VLQVRGRDCDAVLAELSASGLDGCVHRIGRPTPGNEVVVRHGGRTVLAARRSELRAAWSQLSHDMQALRDDPGCAAEEQFSRCDPTEPGLRPVLTFAIDDDIAAPYVARGVRPRVAILREQGVNGQVEMAAAFHRAGFAAVDVHMTDLIEGRVDLADFRGLAACGGFSYGDVLGAGEGWAKSILFHPRLRDAFATFLARSDAFALGVCNGCQMLSNLRELIPGAAHWPRFVRNRSEQFEARLSQVRVEPSPSILLRDMAGSILPIAVAHGEGRAEFAPGERETLEQQGLVAARYVDGHGRPAGCYPHNPNGSPGGITALTTPDGRVTILMPHPERVFLATRFSWLPDGWRRRESPWLRLFQNARRWVDSG
jgi:phosphoribosylformylglycinamidine synthase